MVFWQWVNQSFNALVNYTNRNAKSPLTNTQMGVAYVSASAAACFTAMGFKAFLAKRAGPMMQVLITKIFFSEKKNYARYSIYFCKFIES